MTARRRIAQGRRCIALTRWVRIVARRLTCIALALAAAAPVAVSLPSRAFAAAPAASPATIDGVRLRRFALMAGFNDGGPTRQQLRYATSDARAMSRVLQSLGGVAPDDIVFVSEATRTAFLSAFDLLGRLVAGGQRAGVRREVVVYYSGHSDEDGLLIGNDRVSYDELRARIQGIPAEVRLAILDSCASGAFTRRKGGVRRAPFLMDGSADTKGHAYLASSAINEVAQESDRIGASFFTHYLVSGLRGAADVNRDRRVTLQEAFQFAAQETLARTEKTQGGPQHAAYEFDLAGTSDLVVTDVRSTQATLALASDLSGRIGVRDAAGNLVVELRKMGGHGIELGLEAGPYVVTMDGNGTVFEASVTLALGQRAELARLAFHPGSPLERVATRGDAPVPASDTTVTAAAPPRTPLRSVPVHLGLVPMPGDAEVDVHGVSFSFIADRVGGLSSGLQLSLGANVADQFMYGTQLTIGANLLRGPGRGAQLAVGANLATDSFRGAQLTSGANVVLRDFHGAQLAAGANWVDGETHGAQLGAGVNFARGGGRGAQLAGGLNLTLGRWGGAQLAGGANLADEISGVQLAPLNVASVSKGAQIGVVNVAADQNGTQIGVANVANRSRGFKLGVVNFAKEHDGETFGLLNIIGNGIHGVAAYATESMLTNIALQLGSRHFYTSYIFGYQPGDAVTTTTTTINGMPTTTDTFHRGTRRIGYGLGIGYRQPLDLGPVRFLAIEASAMSITSDFSTMNNTPLYASTRAVVGIQVVRSLSIIAGISDNAAIGFDNKDLDIGPGFLEGYSKTDSTTVRHYPGLLLGMQI